MDGEKNGVGMLTYASGAQCKQVYESGNPITSKRCVSPRR